MDTNKARPFHGMSSRNGNGTPLGQWDDSGNLQHGLDITANNFTQELSKTLTINLTLNGFQDFSQDGSRAIEPASPDRSLLYHALASASVHPTSNNHQPSVDADDYPTLEELDTIENYIYSVANRQLSDFPNAVIAVFAYQCFCLSISSCTEKSPSCSCRHGLSEMQKEDSR